MTKVTKSQILATMKTAPMFSALDGGTLVSILDRCQVLSFSAGQQIFWPTQRAERFFLVLAGRVKIYQLSARGGEQILHLYGPGETFAEAVVLAERNYPAYAEAAAECQLLAIRRNTLKSIIAERADVALGMLAGLSSKLQEFNRLIERLSLKDVPARLAGWLLDASKGGQVSTIHLTQTKRQLASQLGTVPETLSRTLAKFKAAGLVKVNGANITILNPRGLAEQADRP
jgi:CRP/FNR family transcriptional regulator, dissimilatory nitrate respiration regulator